MAVISTRRARHRPIPAPTTSAGTSSVTPSALIDWAARPTVAASAMAIPATPYPMPDRAVSCLDSPARLMMNSRPATIYAAWAALVAVIGSTLHKWPSGQPFENMPSMRRVTANPPKTLMVASSTAPNASTVTTRLP